MGEFSHLDEKGQASMVDVGNKKTSRRIASAQAIVYLPDEVMRHFNGTDMITKKGSVFQTARLAGIMAAKKTADLIPLCHPLGLDNCEISIEITDTNTLRIIATARLEARTGVEMEALTAASVAALTVYDMCKGLSHNIVIKEVLLISKTGGKRDFIRG